MFEVESSKFHSANHLSNIKAKVILSDNTNYLGYLSLNTLHNINSQATIHIPKERKQIELPIQKITAYEIDDEMYFLKYILPYHTQINLLGKQAPKQSFVKLLTPKNYFIQLFSSTEFVNDAKSSLPKTKEHIYFSVNEFNNALIDINHPEFPIHFNKKINELALKNAEFGKRLVEVTDIKKINHKSLERKVEILKAIAALHYETNG
jgi:hypothetical protein